MICKFCGGETIHKKVRRQHWLNNKLYIVKNVDTAVCLECGERDFHTTILDQIDRLLTTEHPVKQHLNVKVVSL
jgi:YgiT-type zinc finger domain-containing protein